MKTVKSNRLFAIILSISTALLLVAVIVLSCLLIRETRGDDFNLSEHEKYYNAKCNSFALQNFNASKGQIVFVGDSITDLYPLDDYYQSLNLATYNRGIGGDTTQGVLNRLDVSIFDIAPKAVVLLIGTNDVNGGIDNSVILNRYQQIVTKIYEKLPSVKLYLTSIIPQNKVLETYTSVNVATSTAKILALNPEIEKIANTYGATYVNLFPLLSGENNLLISSYSDDGIHLNANGFAVWSSLLFPHLQLVK